MRIILIAGLACFVASTGRADVESGPKPGEKVPPLKVLSVVGDEENKEIDAARLRAKKPTIYLFIRADRWTRPIAKTMKVIDEAVDKLGGEIKVVAVWLTDDAEKTKAYLPKAQDILKLDATTLALYPDLMTGPEHWGINSDADLTVVVADGQKITARFGYVAPNTTVAPEVLAALKKVVKKPAA
jgi:hypothetical protein